MIKNKGYIDLSIIFPVLAVLGLIGYMGITDTGWSDLPWWVYVLLVLVVTGSIVLPSRSQFPNAGLGDLDDRNDSEVSEKSRAPRSDTHD